MTFFGPADLACRHHYDQDRARHNQWPPIYCLPPRFSPYHDVPPAELV